MSNTDSSDTDDILTFVLESKGFFHTAGCEIRRSDYGGLGVFALKDLKEDTVLLRIPKSSVFTAENSSIANLLVDSEVKGMLALNIAYIYEVFIFQVESHWYKYLKSISHRQNGSLYLPPAYWEDNEKILLKNTALDVVFEALSPQEEIENGFKVGIALSRKWNEEFGLKIPYLFDFNLEDQKQVSSNFKEFAAIAFAISSRVFEIDNYHDSGLVAIADLFNHHATRPDVRFESMYDVCDMCGELGDCKHVIAETKALDMEMEQRTQRITPRETGTISLSVIEELERELDPSDSESVEETVSDENAEETPEAIMPKNIDTDECVDIILSNDVKAGEEIFNSYGDHSNSYLLARYRFCIEDNPHDVVDLSEELLEYGQKNSKRIGDRMEWWEDEVHAVYKEWYEATREESEEEEEEEEGEEGEEEENENESPASDSDSTSSELSSEETPEENDAWGYVHLKHSGKPNDVLLAILNLLTMSPSMYKNLSSARGDVEKLAKKLPLLEAKLSGDGKRLLKQICAAKKYAKLPSDLKTYNLQQIELLINSEKQILNRVR